MFAVGERRRDGTWAPLEGQALLPSSSEGPPDMHTEVALPEAEKDLWVCVSFSLQECLGCGCRFVRDFLLGPLWDD